MAWAMERAGEPSTWASVAVLLSLAGVTLPQGSVEALAQIGAGLAALLGVIMRERGA